MNRETKKPPWWRRWFGGGGVGRSGYVGARKGRRTSDWITSGASGNAELSAGMVTLRERSRDVRRNNPHGAAALVTLANYVSGMAPQSGILPARSADGTITDEARRAADELNTRIDALWADWARVCLVDGGTFATAQTQATLGMFESGETFTRVRPRRLSDGLPVPVQIELLEADYCDHTINRTTDTGGAIIQGVEFDALGRRSAYHMLRRHPGEALLGLPLGAAPLETVALSADNVAHLFNKPFVRPGQARGVPHLHAILQALRDFEGLQDAERLRAKVAASFMGVVRSSESFNYPDEAGDPTGINPVRDANGDIMERFRAGTWVYAEDGQEIEFNRPPEFRGYKDHAWTDLHAMAAGIGLPYELMTGDLSGTNYSSIMFGMGSFWRLAERIQTEALEPLWCRRVWRWFVDFGQAAGILPDEAGPVRWVSKPFPQVDPVKQNRGKLLAVRAGALTLSDWIRETGQDPEHVLGEHRRLQAWAIDNGVVLDALPNVSSLAGQVQQSALDALVAANVDDEDPAA